MTDRAPAEPLGRRTGVAADGIGIATDRAPGRRGPGQRPTIVTDVVPGAGVATDCIGKGNDRGPVGRVALRASPAGVVKRESGRFNLDCEGWMD